MFWEQSGFSLARNNFWAFSAFRDLLQQYLCYLFPVVLIASYSARLLRIVTCLNLCAAYLGLYSVTHGGVGPGGFLGDENDMALTLLGLVGISLGMFPVLRFGFPKLVLSGSAIALSLVGIVASSSRGGFVGLLLLLSCAFWRTTHKIAMIGVGITIVLGATLFVPTTYWNEMRTITNTEESTAKGRIEIWKIGLNMWLSPEIFLFGSGMQNTPNRIAEYEPDFNRSSAGKSVGGRAVHSSYIQLMCDLGLAGILLFLTAVGGAMWANRRTERVTSISSRKTWNHSTDG